MITPETQSEWIEKASHLKQRELEKEVVKENPKTVTRASLIPLTSEYSLLSLSLEDKVVAKLKKVQSILSQKKQKSLKYEETLESLLDSFLEKEEKLSSRIKKNTDKNSNSKDTTALSSRTKDEASKIKATPKSVTPRLKRELRHEYNHQCTFKNPDGSRCSNTFSLDAHHKEHRIDGGSHELKNLDLLCSNHHRFLHRMCG